MKHFSDIVPAREGGQERLQDVALLLDLAGPLRLTDAGGSDLTPSLRKAQGLLALIGTAPGLRRSRTWLQDKLWSDRGQAQGAGSLRQCLRRLRAGLGQHADCLRTTPGWIALDPARVRVRARPSAAEFDDDVEFLEGLDIGDPEFEDWLRDQRLRHSEPSRDAAPETGQDELRTPHPDPAGIYDPHIGAMVAAAALAGYLMERRDAPSGGGRPVQDDLRAALRSGHVARAREVVQVVVPILEAQRRDARGLGSPALRRH